MCALRSESNFWVCGWNFIPWVPEHIFFLSILMVCSFLEQTFGARVEILWCDHSNETSSAVLSHGAICLVCSSNFGVCGENPLVSHQDVSFGSMTEVWKLNLGYLINYSLILCLSYRTSTIQERGVGYGVALPWKKWLFLSSLGSSCTFNSVLW